ncbi:hypothetical protein [Luteibacter anthropi]|uniref:Uncharacterized protein n=1 Tax=Luteibacter anthropi TaxID=564369 RepID=A0A7X5UAU0_9GAMM|nr:hypothetical protein [Luteibacter anthropi]NII06942.1 hypothetical protein [Luteibacter anthropi]
MTRAFALAVFLMASATTAFAANKEVKADSDTQAIAVTQDQSSPWLQAEVRKGEVEHVGQGKTTYFYLHLLTPINFVAAIRKDNFSGNAFHVYDLSFGSAAGDPAGSNIESMVGKTIWIQGRVSALPTAHAPTSMYILVTAMKQ